MGSPFPPISWYGFLSDGHTGALIAPDGSVEWLCVPRFDSPSAFAATLDRGAGSFRFAPEGVMAPLSRHYVPGTLVVQTTWTTGDAWLVVRDALTVREWAQAGGDERAQRPRTDHEPDRSLVRVATCIDGELEMELECHPAFGYGVEPATWSGDAVGEARAFGAGQSLYLRTDLNLSLDGDTARGRLHLREGDTCFCAIGWDDDVGPPSSAPEAEERLSSTEEYWRTWLRHGSFPDHPWRIFLIRSAIVLKGLTYAPTGAIVAAPTTSLPETPGGERNWDYRYSWIRDSTFSLWALHTLGFEEEARDYMNFMLGVSRDSGGELQIMYGIGGESNLSERTLDHLSGYEGARPVRIGNGAFSQRQNDVWGALLDSIYLHAKALRGSFVDARALVAEQVEAAIEAWPHPDQGIWEARGEPKHYVSSKVMIWVAVDRGARLAFLIGRRDFGKRWAEIADGFREEILDRGVRGGVFRQHYDTDALDASALLIPLVRFLPHDDERVRGTVLAIADELTENGLVLRYRPEDTDDGLSGQEGTFLICSFWLVSALSEIGEEQGARVLCERLIAAAGPLNLYAEELDPLSGRHLGNFPQAFTHLALINAVSHVIADELREERVGATAVFSEMRKAG
jgi:alpha,alpha-trehalase